MMKGFMICSVVFLCALVVSLQCQTIEFKEATDWHRHGENSTLVCSVSDFYYNNNSKLYWVEYNNNRQYKYPSNEEDSIISDIYAEIFDDTLSNPLYKFKVTNNGYDRKLQNTTSLPQSCSNPKTNDIITSYSIGYIRNNENGRKFGPIEDANDTISTHVSVYWQIFEMGTFTFTEKVLAVDGLSQPYSDKTTPFNFNFNANVLCHEDFYLVSWYHWDKYETYLQYRIISKDSLTGNYIQTPIITANSTMIYNVSLLINAFGRTKTILSKWDNRLFLGVFNNYDKYVKTTIPIFKNNAVEYATTVKGVIGKVYYNTSNEIFDINWINETAFVMNQVRSDFAIGYETGTLESGYVKVLNNPNNNDVGCCFVVLYGETYGINSPDPITTEVWGICTLYLTILDDKGNHILSKDEDIFDFKNLVGICNPYDPGNIPFEGVFGNAQIIELEMLRGENESYFMIGFTTNFVYHSELRGVIYKLYYDFENGKYKIDKIDSNLYDKNEFIAYSHEAVDPKKAFKQGKLTMDVCFHINNNSKQLFVGFTLNNVTDDFKHNNQTLKQPLMTKIYNVSVV